MHCYSVDMVKDENLSRVIAGLSDKGLLIVIMCLAG